MHIPRTVSSLVYFAAYATGSAVIKRQTSSSTSSASSSTSLVADSSCTNGPDTRACWTDGYSIATDFDQKNPTTGNTRTYDWHITNTTKNLDGSGDRTVFLVNDQYPGPALYATWGDMISVTVYNDLPYNGTGIHWHGVRQYNTVDQDGVPGITECPIAPGDSRTYTFKATQFGTSWYHSHFSVQYGMGIVGPIIIDGPASGNYDEDLGALPLTDLYTLNSFQTEPAAFNGPVTAANGLINGTMVDPNGGTTGSYYKTTITAGKKYRVRIVNTSVDNGFMVSLDNHPFSVITADFVPIKPYSAEWLYVAIGQRYDVIITANQTADNYWFRAVVPGGDDNSLGCGENANNGNIKSIFHYSNATSGNPTSSEFDLVERCTDETTLVPYWDSFVPSDPLTANPSTLDVTFTNNTVGSTDSTVFKWAVNLTALDVDWNKPILQYVQEDNTSWPITENVVEIADDADWTYWILQEVNGALGDVANIPHPIHLHGHDFYVLGAQAGATFSSSDVDSLNFDNPTRRDTAMLPQGGWLAIAFETNNPGAWIMHCHIAWHVGDGLAVQFLESKDSIPALIDGDFTDICQSWSDFYPDHSVYQKDDSGV